MAQGIGPRVKAAITDNLSLKVLSLCFALILYSLVHGTQDAQRSVGVSLLVLLPPESSNRVLVNQLPPQVRVTLRGSRAVIDDLRAEDLGNIQVDLHSGQQRRVVLEPSMVHVPVGVRVEQIEPAVLELQWEERGYRDIPVQVSVVGAPAPGFVVHSMPVAEPNSVRVSGPRTELALMQFVRADGFDVNGLTEGRFTRQLALDPARGRLILDTTSVQVTAVIARETVERLFSRVPVNVVGASKGRAIPSEVDVKVMCPPEVVRALRPEQLVVKVEVTSKEPAGAMELPVSVTADTCKVQVTPSRVIVRWP